MSHGRPSVGTVPGMVHLAHVGNEFLHLACVKSSSNHHLNRRHSKIKFIGFHFSLKQRWTRLQLNNIPRDIFLQGTLPTLFHLRPPPFWEIQPLGDSCIAADLGWRRPPNLPRIPPVSAAPPRPLTHCPDLSPRRPQGLLTGLLTGLPAAPFQPFSTQQPAIPFIFYFF